MRCVNVVNGIIEMWEKRTRCRKVLSCQTKVTVMSCLFTVIEDL